VFALTRANELGIAVPIILKIANAAWGPSTRHKTSRGFRANLTWRTEQGQWEWPQEQASSASGARSTKLPGSYEIKSEPSARQGVLRYLNLPLRRRHQMRSLVHIGQRQRDRRYTASQPRQHCVEGAIGLIRLRLLVSRSSGHLLDAGLARQRAVLVAIARGMSATRQSCHVNPWRGRYRLHRIHLFPISPRSSDFKSTPGRRLIRSATGC
jgi:hypothetical protein